MKGGRREPVIATKASSEAVDTRGGASEDESASITKPPQ